ncbi:PDDEXK family nuclease [Brucella grignonensis]|uniref:hypothetical protein n=1 Tax=Brucella grignonensis TaxID=94627 RepID=UPI002E275A79
MAYGKPMDFKAMPSVRRRMQRTRRRDNQFEASIRSQLYGKGFRYRVHYPVPRMKRITCDIAFPSLNIAIFLDGCFWHGCNIHPPSVKKNTGFGWRKSNAIARVTGGSATTSSRSAGQSFDPGSMRRSKRSWKRSLRP